MLNNINISIIVAMSKNHVIGNKNQLPWHLPKDLQHFKNVTTGKNVLMGKNTFTSIFSYINKPLPNRTNFVLTTTGLEAKYTAFDNLQVFNNIQQVEDFLINTSQTDICVIGGEQIYKQMLQYANKLIISHVDIECDGDAFFPQICPNTWQIESEELVQDNINFTIKVYIPK
jgi:dihydrofolate reductase